MFGKASICGWVANPPKSIGKTMTIASLNLGFNTGKKTPEGNKESAFMNCVLFNKNAEFALDNFEKGDLVYVDGNLILNQYTDKNGIERETFQLNANYSCILKKKNESVGEYKAQKPKPKREIAPADDFEADDSEIPF